MWNIIAILLIIFAIYEAVRSLRDRGVIRDILNDRPSVQKIREIISSANGDDAQIVKEIRNEFNIHRYPAIRLFADVRKMKKL
ncbi:hypothetical protein [Apilactobacillus bombintestini]|uniref:Uncharacterized protein n=1 Tax=Apilactobacillus bombintestini TaxID=2419772 RepID=A0A387AQA3_9LACO|nr:hypothetical protein [Apilactobacillus bombintestini]AYF92097.1 hypothetical protein D7I45_00640 [Apilactobacillus bombintestini]